MLKEILLNEFKLHPQMQLQDLIKLIFQSSFGSDHFAIDKDTVNSKLKNEWELISPQDRKLITDIGNGYCRLDLMAAKYNKICPEIIAKLFYLTAENSTKNTDAFNESICVLKACCTDGTLPFECKSIDDFIENWQSNGCKPVSHTQIYRDNYSPAYRVIKKQYAQFLQLLNDIYTKKPSVVAIDGRCASGKSTLGKIISEVFDCNLFHADDYFLPLSKRTPERLEEAGGNLDYERFQSEIIDGIKSNKQFTYTPFLCRTKSFGESVTVTPSPLTVIEGSYCMNPHIEDIYDMKIFVTTDSKTQLDRILARNGSKCLEMFKSMWIPMEEKYFMVYNIQDKCDYIFNT